MPERGPWKVALSDAAAADYLDILRWTVEHFGRRQARRYADTLDAAIEALAEGPDVPGAKRRDEILPGILSLHVARHGRKGRHFLTFRTARSGGDRVIELLRILHEAMDLPRHLET